MPEFSNATLAVSTFVNELAPNFAQSAAGTAPAVVKEIVQEGANVTGSLLESLQSYMPDTSALVETAQDYMPAPSAMLNTARDYVPDSATALEAASDYWHPVAVAVGIIGACAAFGLIAKRYMDKGNSLKEQEERLGKVDDSSEAEHVASSVAGSPGIEDAYRADNTMAIYSSGDEEKLVYQPEDEKVYDSEDEKRDDDLDRSRSPSPTRRG